MEIWKIKLKKSRLKIWFQKNSNKILRVLRKPKQNMNKTKKQIQNKMLNKLTIKKLKKKLKIKLQNKITLKLNKLKKNTLMPKLENQPKMMLKSKT